jgi:hypothetical protein
MKIGSPLSDRTLGIPHLHHLYLIGEITSATRDDDPALKFELIAIPAALLLGLAAARFRMPAPLRQSWRRLAARRTLSVAVVGLTALLLCLAYGAVAGLPVPEFHDEFAYLLAADTYAHGRLTNPPHPLWVHFESFHILQQPTYMAKFPPGQGLFLALGQVLTGYPIVGVWLSWALACAATCWMLQAWVPPRWALLGGLLTVLHPGMFVQWGNSYWGGAVAMLGGALVFGSFRRLLREIRGGMALTLGAGLSLLALSRPAEGLVASLPVAAVLLTGLWRGRLPLRPALGRLVLPAGLVLAGAGAFLGYSHYRITGSPWLFPHQIHEETYAVAPIFFWQQTRSAPAYRHDVMRQFFTGWALEQYDRHHLSGNLLAELTDKCKKLWRFALQAVLAVPFVTLPWLWRSRWVRFALLDVGLVLVVVLQISWLFPHYAAPAACLVVFLVVQGLRQMHAGSRRLPLLRLLVPALVVVFVASSLIDLQKHAHADPNAWNRQRALLQARLEASGGKHLVLVRYSDRHLGYQEWVYNGADIDGAAVVWARDMGTDANRRLLEYFADRHIWLLDADGERRLLPLSGSGS